MVVFHKRHWFETHTTHKKSTQRRQHAVCGKSQGQNMPSQPIASMKEGFWINSFILHYSRSLGNKSKNTHVRPPVQCLSNYLGSCNSVSEWTPYDQPNKRRFLLLRIYRSTHCRRLNVFFEIQDPHFIHTPSNKHMEICQWYEPVSTWGCCISCSVIGTVSVASPGIVVARRHNYT